LNPTLLIAVLTPFAATVGASLGYYATRKRDTGTGEVDRGRLALDDAKAALEAWAEYATVAREDVKTSRMQVATLELAVAELRVKLEECLQRRTHERSSD
jgi:hypothetical protein